MSQTVGALAMPFGRRLLCTGANCTSTTAAASLEAAQESSKMNTATKAVVRVFRCAIDCFICIKFITV